MNSKSGRPERFELNKYVIVITALFVLTLVAIFALPPATSDLRLLPAGLGTFVAGIVGWRASRMFGGRRNFIGRVLIFFSLAIFGYTIAAAVTLLEDLQLFHTPVLLSASGISTWIGVLAGCFSAYALVASVRSLWDRYDHKTLVVVSSSLALALLVGSTNLVYADAVFGQTTVSDTVLWVGLVPTLAFLQLASAILLLRLLGRWYAAKNLAVLALAYVSYSALIPLMTSLVAFLLVQSANFDTAFFYIRLSADFALYLVCIAMTQVKPRVTGPFY
jgi:hypothetical protein